MLVGKDPLVMIVYSHGHDLLCMLLADHILVELGLDLMRGQHIADVDFGRGRIISVLPFFLPLLLHLLAFGNPAKASHQVLDIEKVQRLQRRKVQVRSGIVPSEGKILHGIKSLLHTVAADGKVPGNMDHLPGHALGPAADVADVLIAVLLFIRAAVFVICRFCIGLFIYRFPVDDFAEIIVIFSHSLFLSRRQSFGGLFMKSLYLS